MGLLPLEKPKPMPHHTNEVRRIVADFSNLLTDREVQDKIHPFGPEQPLLNDPARPDNLRQVQAFRGAGCHPQSEL